MHELIVNLHMHTPYSDGHLSHQQIAEAAMEAGIDAVIVTDHNVWVDGPEGYYYLGERRALLLVGEEIHDQARDPQKNHLLVFGARRELATYAYEPQRLLDAVNQAGGLAFLAHPVDPAAPAVGEGDISWVSWEVQGFHGLELWNGFSEFKSLLKSKLHALFYAYNPRRIARGPHPTALRKWDELLAEGRKGQAYSVCVAVGGSDAHGLPKRLGPLRKTIFPYTFHFRCVNTHVLLPHLPVGDARQDGQMVLDALRQGHCFVGYDLPHPTRGFRFTAQDNKGTAIMGDEVSAKSGTSHPGGVTLQIKLPSDVVRQQRTECRLLKDGKPEKTWTRRDLCTYIATQPGVYRVEVYLDYLGMKRGWIFSNPVYVRGGT
ncbi:MAG: CehA/McbA family metallohydrolase [Anaerolineales bacterium]|nr:CehA/McbA family metallohydrolase [Anaerolineales bacterium]